MTGKDLLTAMSGIDGRYIEEAAPAAAPKRRSLRRPLLVAAAIAAALLLVGCGIVYALRLQDMSIGKATYTQRFDDKGKAIDPVEKSLDIITPYGRSGDAIQQALKEWYEFQESYDPDYLLATNEPDIPSIPNQYEYTYGCYTQEMVDKVDEIAAKYDLKLLEEWIPFQRYQSDIFLEETGIQSLLLPDSGAQITGMAGMLYPPYNFSMEFNLVTENAGTLMTSYGYARKDYFPRAFPGGMDIDAYEQWDHTTPGGTKLLLALNSKGQGEVIAEQENAMIMISIDGNRATSHTAYPDASEVMTKAELESIADQFDYSVQPKEVNRAVVEEKLAAAEADYQAEHTYVPETYADFSDYLKKSVYIPDESRQYAFSDLTGDGVDELLLGRNGAFSYWLSMENGEVVDNVYADTYLCKGNILELYQAPDMYWDIERHTYVKPENGGYGNKIVAVERVGNQWYRSYDIYERDKTEISQDEAAAIMAKYPRIQLDWKPLMDYPLDESGLTLGSYLKAKDVQPSDDELLRIYKDCLSGQDSFYTHYRIMDINGDGVKDLLRSGDGDHYWDIVTYRYGNLQLLSIMDFYLCENNVMEQVELFNRDEGVEIEGTRFLRCNGFDREELDFVAYNKATASWQSDYIGTPMSEADAKAILAKYSRVDQGMQPISQLLNG
ncbi:MAG: hypothetical protein HPZ81_09600 [Oscillospiraceae bacterium]|nr:hypothetical protein [Oscillospiraceae bacterium]